MVATTITRPRKGARSGAGGGKRTPWPEELDT